MSSISRNSQVQKDHDKEDKPKEEAHSSKPRLSRSLSLLGKNSLQAKMTSLEVTPTAKNTKRLSIEIRLEKEKEEEQKKTEEKKKEEEEKEKKEKEKKDKKEKRLSFNWKRNSILIGLGVTNAEVVDEKATLTTSGSTGKLSADSGGESPKSGQGSRVGVQNSKRASVRQVGIIEELLLQVSRQAILSEDESVEAMRRLRNKCINEIIVTEADYVDDLTFVVKHFINPLQSSNMIPEDSTLKIFSNIPVLLNVNKELLKDLVCQAMEHKGEMIGPCFEKMAAYLKMYSQFCSNQQTALDTLDSCIKKSQTFKKFLKDKETDECGGLSLGSYLIKPVQRLCKYPLFLRELLKCTPPNHPDYAPLKHALSSIESVTQHVNEITKKVENAHALYEISKRFEKSVEQRIMEEKNRIFVHEGGVKEIKKEGKGLVEKDIHLIVFNNLLLKCIKKSEKKFKLSSDPVVLENTFLIDVSEDVFQDSFALHSGNNKFTFITPSADDKNCWMQALKTHFPLKPT